MKLPKYTLIYKCLKKVLKGAENSRHQGTKPAGINIIACGSRQDLRHSKPFMRRKHSDGWYAIRSIGRRVILTSGVRVMRATGIHMASLSLTHTEIKTSVLTDDIVLARAKASDVI